MAVERTVNINFQTNAPKAAAEVAQVDKSLQGVAASGNQAAGAMDRATSSRVEGGFGRIGRSLREATKPARDFVGALSGVVGLASRIGGLFAFAGAAVDGLGRLFGSESPQERQQREDDRQQAIRARIGGQLTGRGQQGAALAKRLEALRGATMEFGNFGTDIFTNEKGQVERIARSDRELEMSKIRDQLANIEKKQAADIEAMRKATETTARNTGAANRFRAR